MSFVELDFGMGGRHFAGGFSFGDALDEGAVCCVARDDDFGESAFFGVEAELGHAGGFVGAVALEAGVGEDGADFAEEVYGFGGGGESGGEEEEQEMNEHASLSHTLSQRGCLGATC